MIKCNFKLESETAKMPTKHTAESAGIDFYADEDVVISPNCSEKISLGVSWSPEIPEEIGTMFNPSIIIQSRSGLAFKKDIEASNAGVIDFDYQNTPKKKTIIKCKLYNNSYIKNFKVKKGDKICQGVLHLVPKTNDVEILDDSRDGKGFGSSDAKEK